MGVTSEHLIQVTCSLSSLSSVFASFLSLAWKERQSQNQKQNLNHNLKQNHFPPLDIHHTSQVLIQGPGIGMDSHLPEVIIHGKGMDPHFTTETEEIEKLNAGSWRTQEHAIKKNVVVGM